MIPTRRTSALVLITTLGLTACSTGGFSPFGTAQKQEQVFAPGVEVGHRLMAAGQYELALKSFNRAALDRGGLDAEILSGMGSANLGLGRLGQAEVLLRRAIKAEENKPEDWNNLGVVLMESGKNAEAIEVFKRAYALDNGESDAIRDNLRLALAKNENSASLGLDDQNYKLVRRGAGDYVISEPL
jgi:Flp pilus assembly protein TadD